jgi:hypothetical protein
VLLPILKVTRMGIVIEVESLRLQDENISHCKCS